MLMVSRQAWYGYAVLDILNFAASNYSLQLVEYTDSVDSSKLFNISTWKGDLSAFKNRGGKVISYHGQQDPLISPSNSLRYYNHVQATMGLTSTDLDDFYRLFRISGMGHCSGGPGAANFGQSLASVTSWDSENNVLKRIVDWVENGAAPDTLRGTAYVNQNASQGVAFRREHCRYPYRNVYVGPGDYTNAGAWECVPDSF